MNETGNKGIDFLVEPGDGKLEAARAAEQNNPQVNSSETPAPEAADQTLPENEPRPEQPNRLAKFKDSVRGFFAKEGTLANKFNQFKDFVKGVKERRDNRRAEQAAESGVDALTAAERARLKDLEERFQAYTGFTERDVHEWVDKLATLNLDFDENDGSIDTNTADMLIKIHLLDRLDDQGNAAELRAYLAKDPRFAEGSKTSMDVLDEYIGLENRSERALNANISNVWEQVQSAQDKNEAEALAESLGVESGQLGQMWEIANKFKEQSGGTEFSELGVEQLYGWEVNFDNIEDPNELTPHLYQVVGLLMHGKITPAEFEPYRDLLNNQGWDTDAIAAISERFQTGNLEAAGTEQPAEAVAAPANIEADNGPVTLADQERLQELKEQLEPYFLVTESRAQELANQLEQQGLVRGDDGSINRETAAMLMQLYLHGRLDDAANLDEIKAYLAEDNRFGGAGNTLDILDEYRSLKQRNENTRFKTVRNIWERISTAKDRREAEALAAQMTEANADIVQMWEIASKFSEQSRGRNQASAQNLADLNENQLKGWKANFDQISDPSQLEPHAYQVVGLLMHGRISISELENYREILTNQGWDVDALATVGEQFQPSLLDKAKAKVGETWENRPRPVEKVKKGIEKHKADLAERERRQQRMEQILEVMHENAFHKIVDPKKIQELTEKIGKNELSDMEIHDLGSMYIFDLPQDQLAAIKAEIAKRDFDKEFVLGENEKYSLVELLDEYDKLFIEPEGGDQDAQPAAEPDAETESAAGGGFRARLKSKIAALRAKFRRSGASAEEADAAVDATTVDADEDEETLSRYERLENALMRPGEKAREYVDRINKNFEAALEADRQKIVASVKDEEVRAIINAFKSGELTPEQEAQLAEWESNFTSGEDGQAPEVDHVIALLMTDRIGESWQLNSLWKAHKTEIGLYNNGLKLREVIKYKKRKWLEETRTSETKGSKLRWLNTKFFNGWQSILPVKVPVDKLGRPSLKGRAELNKNWQDSLRNILTTEGLPSRQLSYAVHLAPFLLLSPALAPLRFAAALSPWTIKGLVSRATGSEVTTMDGVIERIDKRSNISAKVLRWANEKAQSDFVVGWFTGMGEAARMVTFAVIVDALAGNTIRELASSAFDGNQSVEGAPQSLIDGTSVGESRTLGEPGPLRDVTPEGLQPDAVDVRPAGEPGPLRDITPEGFQPEVVDVDPTVSTGVPENLLNQGDIPAEPNADTVRETLAEMTEGADQAGEVLAQTQDFIVESGDNVWNWYADKLNSLGLPNDVPTINALKNISREVGLLDDGLKVGAKYWLLDDSTITNISEALQEAMQPAADNSELRQLLLKLGPGATEAGLVEITEEQVQKLLEAAASGSL